MQPPKSSPTPSTDAPFASLRPGRPDCPSELALDRFFCDELTGDEKTFVSSHVGLCTVCAERLSQRRAGFDAFPDLDARPLLAGVHRKLADADAQTSRRFSFGKILAVLTSSVAVSAAVAVVLLASKPSPVSQTDVVREKGSAALHVYRKTGDRSVELLSGDTFAPGDHLRFVVDLPRPSRVSVLGVESMGALFVAWPQDEKTSTQREAGKAQALEGAVVLDEKLGRETLYLVSCPPQSEDPSTACKLTDASQPPSCPSGCVLSPFVLQKK